MSEPVRRPRVGMISLGCPKNLVDSEIMLGELARRGYDVVQDMDSADTVVVNTCAFIEEAQQESIDTILEVVARKGKGVEKVLVAGCMVNRFGDQLAREIPEIDGFVGLDQLRDVGQVVQLGGGPPLPAPSHMVFDHTAPRLLTTRGFAYLKVAEGCNNPCTFCAIPIWRGQFRSRTIESLVEARQLEAAGITELNLIAQDTTRYGEDLGMRRHGLVRLVEALLEATSIPWIRFLYAYPTTLDEDLLRLMGTEERFCSYLDMPLQHSHGDILTAMRRGGDAKRDLLSFIKEARLDHLGAFAYSPEDATPGAKLPGRVPKQVARRRLRQLLEAQKPIALEQRRRLLGQRLRVLVEGPCEETEHLLQGRHYGMAPEIDGRLLINDGTAPAGMLVDVEITEAYADDMVGHIVGPLGVPGVEVSDTADLALV